MLPCCFPGRNGMWKSFYALREHVATEKWDIRKTHFLSTETSENHQLTSNPVSTTSSFQTSSIKTSNHLQKDLHSLESLNIGQPFSILSNFPQNPS